MIGRAARFVLALTFGSIVGGAALAQSPCTACNWSVIEAYSNADASSQFVILAGSSSQGIPYLDGHTLVATDGKTEHTFAFPMGSAFASTYILVGTQGFADLHLVRPDFVVPNGFLPLNHGELDLRPGGWFEGPGYYDVLPSDGVTAVFPYCDSESCWLVPGPAWAANSTGREEYVFPQPGTITPAFTGSWFDPAQSGQGLFIAILPDSQFLAAWFTFNPAGTEQAWFVGVGKRFGSVAVVSDVVQPTGGRWIPRFSPDRVVNNPWGSLMFTFTDCNHGKVDFNSTAGYGTGSMNLTRLTQPAGLTCP